jgi:hypothetical protein
MHGRCTRKRFGIVVGCAAAGMLGTVTAAAADTSTQYASVGAITWRLTKCDGWCGPTALVGTSDDLRYLTLVPQGGTPPALNPTDLFVLLQADGDGPTRTIQAQAVAPDPIQNQAVDVSVRFQDLPAGHYVGSLVQFATGGTSTVIAPVDLQVRDGPLWAVFWLIVSVVAGAVVSWLFELRKKAQFKRGIRQLRARIAVLPKRDQLILEPLLDVIWADRASNFDVAAGRLTALTAGAQALQTSRDLQDSALSHAEASDLSGWVQRVTAATDAVVLAVQQYATNYDDCVGKVRHAATELDDAVKALQSIQSMERSAAGAPNRGDAYTVFIAAAQHVHTELNTVSPDPAQPAPDLEPALASAESSFKALMATNTLQPQIGRDVEFAYGGGRNALAFGLFPGTALLGPPSLLGPLKNAWFDFTAAVGNVGAGVASIVSMLVLLAIGFQTTYLGNATFGTKITDWLTLVFWGLAAYGARRTLTGLGPAVTP